MRRFWIGAAAIVVGLCLLFAQLTPSGRQLRAFTFQNGVFATGMTEWDEWDGTTGSDLKNQYPPCQKTPVEQRGGWNNVTEIQQVFDEYSHEKNIDMVVALCQESMDKVKKYALHLRVARLYIYSKCGQTVELDESFKEQFDHVEVTELPNVGREGHTYLTHVLRDDLDLWTHWTIFVQGAIERSLSQAMLSLVAAHQHDAAQDGTTVINMFRTAPHKGSFFARSDFGKGEFCTPMYLPKLPFAMPLKFARYSNNNKNDKSHLYLDAMVNQVHYRGEFVAKNILFAQVDRTKLLDIHQRLAAANAPSEGYFLEPLWTSVLGGADNCRCDGMPANKLPPLVKNLASKKPTQQSRTVGPFSSKYAVTDHSVWSTSFASARPKQHGQDVSWWEVDLNMIAIVRNVTIHRPLHNRHTAFEGVTVQILNVDERVVASQTVPSNNVGLSVSVEFEYVEGRFVRITKSGWKTLPRTLNLAQVEVAGHPTVANASPKFVTDWTKHWGSTGPTAKFVEAGDLLAEGLDSEERNHFVAELPEKEEDLLLEEQQQQTDVSAERLQEEKEHMIAELVQSATQS